MPSPARLAALLQQRALISQHLAWLDAEIAASTTGSDSPSPLPAPASPAPTPAAPSPESPPALSNDYAPTDPLAQANARADEIIERYRSSEALNPADTRRSCLLLSIAMLLFSTAVIIGIYLIRYR